MGVPFDLLEEMNDSELKTGRFPDDTILLQYSGLTDKYGREIYEGDILKYLLPSEDGGTEYVEEVQFLAGCFDVDGAPVYATVDWNCEVIGNVYEHPELLSPAG